MPQSCFPDPELTTFAFRCEVKKLLLELDPCGGAGPDGIFPFFFTKTADYLAPKISTVLSEQEVSACVGGLVTSLRFLSPAVTILVHLTIILLSSSLSCLRFFRACWQSVLNRCAEKKNLFPYLQFGSCKGLGACDALLTITQFVQKSLDCGCEVCMVGLVFSFAFHHVNHKTLTFKLRQLVVDGPFLSILTEFLSDCRGLLLMASLMSIEMLFKVCRREMYLSLYFS